MTGKEVCLYQIFRWCLVTPYDIRHVGQRKFMYGLSPVRLGQHRQPPVLHDDVIKWKHFPRYWPIVLGFFHRSPVNSPHKGQWRGALMISLICARINSWVNNGEVGDLRHHRGHYDVIVPLAHHRNYPRKDSSNSTTKAALEKRHFVWD